MIASYVAFAENDLNPSIIPKNAVSAVFGAFGAGGMFQSNQAAAALNTYFNISKELTGFVLAIGVGIVIIGGI